MQQKFNFFQKKPVNFSPGHLSFRGFEPLFNFVLKLFLIHLENTLIENTWLNWAFLNFTDISYTLLIFAYLNKPSCYCQIIVFLKKYLSDMSHRISTEVHWRLNRRLHPTLRFILFHLLWLSKIFKLQIQGYSRIFKDFADGHQNKSDRSHCRSIPTEHVA